MGLSVREFREPNPSFYDSFQNGKKVNSLSADFEHFYFPSNVARNELYR